MSPPTEQLIRDYLNRLSVAARGRLAPQDRQALITRTRAFIDMNSGASGPPTPMEVAVLLARLGDPAVLVDQEAARLAAARGEAVTPPAARGGRLGAALRRRNAQASWHWPPAAGSQALQARLLNGAGAESQPAQGGPGSGDRTAPGAGGAGLASQPAGPGNADLPDATSGGHGNGAVPRIRIPRQRGRGDSAGPDQAAAASTGPGPPLPRPTWPSVGVRGATPAVAPVNSYAATGQQVGGTWRQALLPGMTSLAGRILAWARRSPVEAIAIVLLGIGGASYPPVWLLGAGFALASRRWQGRDKGIGLAGPVLLLVVGTALGVSLGTHHTGIGHDVHEGWVYADVLSRIGALAGAGYLLWRLGHVRRPPVVPPWNKPRKVA
jgi:hypothetical protein